MLLTYFTHNKYPLSSGISQPCFKKKTKGISQKIPGIPLPPPHSTAAGAAAVPLHPSKIHQISCHGDHKSAFVTGISTVKVQLISEKWCS